MGGKASTTWGVAVLLLAAIWGAAGPTPTGQAVGAAAVHHVHVSNVFDPGQLTIGVGDTVEFHNHDYGIWHTATDNDGTWDTDVIPGDGTVALAFDTSVWYDYHCRFHTYMRASLEVGAGANKRPTVAITSHVDGETVRGNVTIKGRASDPEGTLSGVEVRIDGGAWSAASGASAWTFPWDTAAFADGAHPVEARSSDGSLHSAIKSRTLVVDNRKPDLVVVAVGASGGRLTYTDLAATVENRGDEGAPASLVAFAYQGAGDPQPVGTVSLPALAPGQRAEVGLEWDTLGKLGRFTVFATADPQSQVVEHDETNNGGQGIACVPHLQGTGLACLLPPIELSL